MRIASLLFVMLTACAVPYVPEPVRHALPLPDDAFARVVEAVRDRYKQLEVADAATFRVQSKWLPFQRGDVPGYRRASVFQDDDGRLQVVVEMYFLEFGADGIGKSPVRGDRRAEQMLAGALEMVLGAR